MQQKDYESLRLEGIDQYLMSSQNRNKVALVEDGGFTQNILQMIHLLRTLVTG